MPVNREREDDGFTLIELLIVVVLLSVVGGIVTAGLMGAMESTRQTQDRTEAMAELQRGAERVSRELRAACPIVGTLQADHVEAEIYRDGERWRHTYRLDAATTSLQQDVERYDVPDWVAVFSDRVLINDVDAVEFVYLDDDGATVTMASDVRAVELRFRRDLAEQPPVEISTLVSLRNGGRSCA